MAHPSKGLLTHRLLRIALLVIVYGLFRPEAGVAQAQSGSDPKTLAQSPSVPPSAEDATTTVLRVSSNLVLVDVVVRDHGGPVHSLDRSDFTIFEDNEDRSTASFDERRPAVPVPDVQSVAAQATALQAALPPGAYTNASIYLRCSR
jgi:hypothetical protein